MSTLLLSNTFRKNKYGCHLKCTDLGRLKKVNVGASGIFIYVYMLQQLIIDIFLLLALKSENIPE
jgi:hypothetical protein